MMPEPELETKPRLETDTETVIMTEETIHNIMQLMRDRDRDSDNSEPELETKPGLETETETVIMTETIHNIMQLI